MRSKIIGLLFGCGIAVAIVAPAFACSFNTQASNDKPQQTAQAEPSSQTKSQ